MFVKGFKKGATVYGQRTGKAYIVISSHQAMVSHGVYENRVRVNDEGVTKLFRASNLRQERPLPNLGDSGVSENLLRQLAEDTLKDD